MLANLIVEPELAISSVIGGIELWFYNVMPSLFPYMIFSSMLFQLNVAYIFQRFFNKPMDKIFNVSGSGILPIVMGYISGYPLGAKLIADLRKENVTSLEESYKLLAMCSSTGPAFIIGIIATQMFDNAAIIPVLLIANYLGSILNTLLLKRLYKEDISLNTFKRCQTKNVSNIINTAIVDSTHNVIKICGYMVFFNLVIHYLDARDILDIFTDFFYKYLNVFYFSPELVKGLFYGLFEITLGIDGISKCSDPLITKVAITALVTAWSGFSIHMQTNSFLVETDLKYTRFLLGKITQSILSTILAVISYKLLYPTALSVYNSFHIGRAFEHFNYPAYYFQSIVALSITTLLLLAFRKKNSD
ncbi:hypothetical protein [Alkalibaculum bacchi]|uniref:hypothetical protein n=1 Tax=Alkalibaculum bacchi TaxID=645887 RepID=UPI0026F2C836|nr:hypothetical protein [Alkalibaculum bacchi]